MEKYGEGSDLSTRVLRSSLYLMAIVGNVMFLYVVVLNIMNILEHSTSFRRYYVFSCRV